MSLFIKANFVVQGLIFSQPFPYISNFNMQVELLEFHHIKVKLALLCLDMLFCHYLAKELTRVQELLKKKASKFTKNLDTLCINIC